MKVIIIQNVYLKVKGHDGEIVKPQLQFILPQVLNLNFNMAEPTNHINLPSIECLEQALADCPCCLVLLSHDTYFLNKLVEIRWAIGFFLSS